MRVPTFAEWYREAHPGLLASVLRAVGRGGLAEEAVDAAFEKAFVRWERVQAMRSPNGWVYRVAVNDARRQLRAEVREADRAMFAGPSAAVPPPGGEAWLVVESLPPRQRAAVILRHVGGLPEAEIASAMGITRGTVSSTLASAYRKLRDALAEPVTQETRTRMELSLAVAISCDDQGCDVDVLATRARERAAYSEAVRNTIKVRPGDLVALDANVIVWRWWHGTVIAAAGRTATVERNATQRAAGDPRTARLEVDVPGDLEGELSVGDTVFFGTEGDRKVVVATAAPEAVVERMAPALPAVAAALEPGA